MRRLALLVLAALAACDGPQDDPCELAASGAPWLAFSARRAGSYDLYLSRADGSCQKQVTSDPANDLFPSYGPGGLIAYASDRNVHAGLRLHDLHTSRDWALSIGSLTATYPAFSPDGTRIAFEGKLPGAAADDLWVVPVAGGDPVQLTTSAASDAGPVWSPDGTSTIYFVSTRDGQYDVYGVPVAGGPAARVTTGSRIIGKPAVSPDGRALYFARTVQGQATTEVVRFVLATRATELVTSQQDSEPSLSPAGDRLAVRSFRGGQSDLYVVNAADGSAPVQLTTDAASDGAPSFAPAR